MTSIRRSPLALGLIGLVVLAAIGGAAGLAYLFLRDAPPAAVTASGSPSASLPVASVGALPTRVAGTIGPGGLDGMWTVDTTIGSFADFSASFVGYRVDETFADNSANTAVGRTPAVSGSLVFDGAAITSVEITADMTRLESDDDRRDGRLRDQAIETGEFPTATFRLTSPIDIGGEPADGETVEATATGELTLHGVTRTVEVPVQAQRSGDVVTVIGSIEILFADYEIERPTSFLVLSIEDHGIMEFQLHFRRNA